MAKKRSKDPAPAARQRSPAPVRSPAMPNGNGGGHRLSHLFSDMACQTARWAGKPVAFLLAALSIVLWAAMGPLFGYSDTWQLVINTSTTIVTFLMVFLIQHTQNRDTMAIQLKLAELIIAVQGAENRLAAAEDLSEEELEEMHALYRKRAEQAWDHLSRRRDALKQAS
jgi:low affinity Fe/Cu permease